MRVIAFAAALMVATPALAEEIVGTVLAFDRFDRIVVLKDKTIWQLSPETAAPAQMSAGDRIRIAYTDEGEDGIGVIQSVEVVEAAK